METCITMNDVMELFVTVDDTSMQKELDARYARLQDILEKDAMNKKVDGGSVSDIVAYYITTIMWRLSKMGKNDVVEQFSKLLDKHTQHRLANRLPVEKYPFM